MHIILGADGHVGSATAQALLDRDEPVTAVLHSDRKAAEWQQRGAQVAVADVHDVDALRRIFRQGRRLFLLNPPADPATDAATEERKTVAAIVAALADSGLEKIVAESTYGAQPGDQLGDLGVLYELEQALAAQSIPASIIRGAYYMSNWDAALQTARQSGEVHTFYPPDFKLPMVAPQDLGQAAARLLLEPATQTGLHYVEGPARYSPADVAAAFAAALHRPVVAVETPRAQWPEALHKMGFSDKAAESFAAMTALTLGADFPPLSAVEQGPTTLPQYVRELVQQQPPEAGH
ncbi:NmrA family NAD(P)-binding protein [Hymenobacter sp. M29]|uniref:NmrA family NAD(P)-binding protein n=1 Tax=Hymenobacter mellowenesis TaxID=3063995 RepID=A0ABT9AEB8_9BACT|nr:NmrA family NAD(P)-binding protein [Hymenobacter sp. M29]MDO7848198.1 NmrA family NAD(P)-binding protein [Hymenobacter sp. M29]